MYDRSGAEGRFFGGFGGHVVDEAVDGHFKPARCGTGGEHLAVFERRDPFVSAEIVYRAAQSDADVAFEHARGSLALSPE